MIFTDEEPFSMPNHRAYRIVKWADAHQHYEAKKCKSLPWIPMPTSFGRKMKKLLSSPSGCLAFSVYVIMCEIAANCDVRGVLEKNGDPFTAEDIRLECNMPIEVIENGIKILIEIGWIDTTEINSYRMTTGQQPDNDRMTTGSHPRGSRTTGQDITGENRTEQNRKEKERRTPSVKQNDGRTDVSPQIGGEQDPIVTEISTRLARPLSPNEIKAIEHVRKSLIESPVFVAGVAQDANTILHAATGHMPHDVKHLGKWLGTVTANARRDDLMPGSMNGGTGPPHEDEDDVSDAAIQRDVQKALKTLEKAKVKQ